MDKQFKESTNKRPGSLVKCNSQPTSTEKKEREEEKKQVLLSRRWVDVYPTPSATQKNCNTAHISLQLPW